MSKSASLISVAKIVEIHAQIRKSAKKYTAMHNFALFLLKMRGFCSFSNLASGQIIRPTKIRSAIIYAQPEKLIIFLAQNSIIIKTAGASITIKSAQKLIILSFSTTGFFILLLYQLLALLGKFLSKQIK